MKAMLTLRDDQGGFALPTVILASVIMLIVLVTSVTAVSSITTALAGQYYGQLAREAAESGLANARACLRATDYVPSWTNATPLKPDTDCYGLAAGASAYIVNANNVRSSFLVNAPDVGTASSVRVASTGKVELVRASTGQVWRTYTYTAAENSRYNDTPQIAGGAGWKTAGHNGYMLASTGILYGWGDNGSNQLGPSSLGTTVTTPVALPYPSGVTRAKKVFNSGQGASILCILATHETNGDQAYCRGTELTGGTDWVPFTLPPGLTALDMVVNGYGTNSACVKASDLQAYCAGSNSAGQLGLGTTSDAYVPFTSPSKFRLDLASPGPAAGSASSLTVVKVFNQDVYTCVIASDSQAYCAGQNNLGQLGQGNTTTNVWVGKSIPGRAQIPANIPVNEVVFSYHGAVEGVFFHVNDAPDASVYMSGNNGYGTANDCAFTGPSPYCSVAAGSINYSTPRKLTTGWYGKLISIGEAGGNNHAICVISSGLFCTGSNNFGEIGLGSCTNRASWAAQVDLGGAATISTLNREATYQMNSVMVITTGGDVYAAGDNTYGKLGRGTALTSCNPTFARVSLPAGVKATAVANGDEYTAFVLGDNGRVYSMGRNNNGQLGDGTTTDRSTPVEVKVPRQEVVY